MKQMNCADLRCISVVVCARNSEATIERCLKSLQRNNVRELIIIDGDSLDNTVQIAKKYTDKIYSDCGRGLASARQLGAEKASGNYIAFIDSDTELGDGNTLSVLLKEIKENDWIAIHSQLIDPRENKGYWESGEDNHWKQSFNHPGERGYLGTIVCLIRKDIILKYKFDLFFRGAAEDGDFYHRVKKEGFKFGVSTAIAYHYHRANFKNFVKQRIWYGKGNARMAWKHHDMLILQLIAPLAIICWGTFFSFRHNVKLVPFYVIWGLSLQIGMLLGFLEVLKIKYPCR
jgi:glycosyltransferase involved in cell wall biosynthesis